MMMIFKQYRTENYKIELMQKGREKEERENGNK